jgi:putative ABC transport system substrate-binding protein
MRRREFIAAFGGAAAWPLVAGAQQKLFRIGFLDPGVDPRDFKWWSVFVEALRDLGWIEGKNFVFEYRFANNRPDRLPELASELVALNVDMIVTIGTLAPLAAKRATSTIPIIMTSAGDPLGSGLVVSLARPGENITGLSIMGPDLGGKRLELLREVLPQLSHVAVLWNSGNPYSANSFKQTQSAAQILGINVQSLGAKEPDDLNGLFQTIELQLPEALITIEDPLTIDSRQTIVGFVTKHRLPAIYGLREFVDVGGLISYGTSTFDLFRRSAGYVDKILKGTKPGDLPVEQPTKFELIINLKAAKEIDLQIPSSILARANTVIE